MDPDGRAQEFRIPASPGLEKMKAKVIAAYGGSCSCCGESEPAFLMLDDQKSDNLPGGSRGQSARSQARALPIYAGAIRQGFPDALVLLCWNCSWARMSGPCPHQGGVELPRPPLPITPPVTPVVPVVPVVPPLGQGGRPEGRIPR